jgi:hypothetical protein
MPVFEKKQQSAEEMQAFLMTASRQGQAAAKAESKKQTPKKDSAK